MRHEQQNNAKYYPYTGGGNSPFCNALTYFIFSAFDFFEMWKTLHIDTCKGHFSIPVLEQNFSKQFYITNKSLKKV